MPTTQSSIPANPALVSEAANTLLRHFPAEVGAAFTRFQSTRSAVDADTVTLAVVQDFIPGKKADTTVVASDQSHLIQDLGYDSVAITELVFFLEDLFQVQIQNTEIMQVRTVGDLRSFVRQKIAAHTPSAQA